MSIEPIKVELNAYNKLQLLRRQFDERSRELEELEGTIRELLIHLNEAEFLKSLSPAYSHIDTSEEQAQLSSLESRRGELHELVNILEELIPQLESEAKGSSSPNAGAARTIQRNSIGSKPAPVAPTPSPAPSPSSDSAGKKPLSFDEFRKKFPSSGV